MSEVAVYTTMKDSGIDWIGSVPSHWAMHTLYQLVAQVKNKNKDLSEKNLLSLSYGKIKRKSIETTEGLLPESFDGYNIIEDGDVVLRLTDLQNDHTSLRVGLVTERGIITSAYTTLRPSEECVSKYMYYLLHTFDIRKGFYGMGSGVRQGLNYDEVKELRVILPTVDEQKAIAAYLDEQCALIDEAIAEAKVSVEELQIWRTSIITKAVTSGVGKKANVKDSGVLWIGNIPSEWSVVKAARIIRSTQNGITRRDLEKSQGTIVLKLKNITPEGNIIYDDANRIDLSPSELESYKLIPNDILFVRVNGSRTLVGKCAIFCGAPEDIAYNDHIIRVRLDNHMCLTEYFKWYMLSDSGKREIELHTSTAAGQYTISGIGLRDIVLTLPSISEQHQICNYLHEKMEEVERLASEKKALISDLESYKRSLIYEVVTGKRKVVQ